MTHTEVAAHIGLSLDEVLQAGVIRYVPREGIDVQSKITEQQAYTVVTDWAIWERSVYVDARRPGAEHRLKLFDWKDDRFSASVLRAYVNAKM